MLAQATRLSPAGSEYQASADRFALPAI